MADGTLLLQCSWIFWWKSLELDGGSEVRQDVHELKDPILLWILLWKWFACILMQMYQVLQEKDVLHSTKHAAVQPVPWSFWFQNQQAKHCNEMLQDHRSWSKHKSCCLNGCKFQAEPTTVCVILPWQSNSSLQDVEDPLAAVRILQRPVTAEREEGVCIFSGFTSVPLLIILVRLGLCNVCTLGLLGLADIVDMTSHR